MLRFIVLVLLFSALAIALTVILLVLTKKADDRYWNDIKKYYDDESTNETKG